MEQHDKTFFCHCNIPNPRHSTRRGSEKSSAGPSWSARFPILRMLRVFTAVGSCRTPAGSLEIGNYGDHNTNLAAQASGAVSIRTGMYSTSGTNIAEVRCAPNYYWIRQGQGAGPISSAFHDAATTKTNGDCLFNVTIGSALRTKINAPQSALQKPNHFPLPDNSAPPSSFRRKGLRERFCGAGTREVVRGAVQTPLGISWQFAIPPRCSGFQSSVWISSRCLTSLPGQPTSNQYVMTTDRRFDLAKRMSKDDYGNGAHARPWKIWQTPQASIGRITLDSLDPCLTCPEPGFPNRTGAIRPRKSDLPGSA